MVAAVRLGALVMVQPSGGRHADAGFSGDQI
jgi:hypothetical protein